MTIQLNLPAQLEERLRQEADRQGLAPDAVTLKILDQHLPKTVDDRRAAAIAMLQQWMEEDVAFSDEELLTRLGPASHEDRGGRGRLL